MRELNLYYRAVQWAEDKNIMNKENSFKQFTKMIEENGEVASALFREDKDLLEDALGDSLVTLIILAEQNGMNLFDCLDVALNVIENRKTKTIDGKVIKESDLK